MTRARTAINLLLLYASKSGAVIVGIFVLPWYQQHLGPQAFGVVASILSLQAFLLMLDLGTSTLVGRHLATAHSPHSNLVTWRSAELLLHAAYFGLLLLAIVASALVPSSLPTSHIVLCVVFFWALTVQNVGQSALLAKRLYALAGGIQMVGVLGRAWITLAALSLLQADLGTFLTAQAMSAVAQMLVTAWLCRRAMDPTQTPLDFNALRARAKELAISGKPQVLFGLSGAAVLQLRKVIIPLFISPTALSPYFLASALCLTRISVLAGPITQYFQPRIIASISAGDMTSAQDNLRKLTLSIVCAVAIPSALLWLGRDFIINLWLNQDPIATEVTRYVEILLPGIALGALGFVPYTVLVAHQDYRAQARLPATLTVVTLLANVAASSMGSVLAICWIYAGYHSLSTVVSWLRSMRLQPPAPNHYALRAAGDALAMLAGMAVLAAGLSLLPVLSFK